MKNLISVIIPTYNRKSMICDAIDSVLSQTYQQFEIIIVDDGSTDGTSELVKLQYKDKVHIIRRNEASNAGVARNLGVLSARGEFLSFLDSDDIWFPNKLAEQMEVMLKDEDIALVGGSCCYMDIDGKPSSIAPSIAPDNVTYEELCIKIRLPGSGSNNLIRKKCFEHIGGFDSELIRAEDKDLWIRLSKFYQVGFTKSVTACIRLHDTARINVDYDVIIECRKKVDKKIKKLSVRRAAKSWSYFNFFSLLYRQSKITALYYLCLSFIFHPTKIDNDTLRLIPTLNKILGR
jgi:glycosyltransferase involved in cell wall biosynthesis